ncbi:uncharacterized protein LOC125023795 [Mugil cephalus]|uniref:uncharacterized protein LOC125023795 n=1 Tax=Mugil cephalus TaxID=48193 RepID=UPI001FB71CBF|nr:uncharacterized protein LOC125023795 [Mugil cephalus]
MKCSLESQRVYPVEVWKLFFQKASPALDQALETLATMAPQNSNLALSSALEALGEVKIANLSREQLQSENLISSLFQTQILPFLASPSNNFLFCLSSTNFSCATYRIVIQAFGNQTAFMDRDRQQAVFTHFIQPFLSRNDTSDPGCVSSYTNSKDWLQANLASFSAFATLQDIQALYFNFSSAEVLSELSSSQLAQYVQSSGASNDTDLIDRVFEELEDGNALENVDEFLTELTANGEVHDFQPAVRDHVMNRTFLIISPHLPHFNKDDYYAWFHVKLVSNPRYVSGIAKVFPAMPLHRKQGLTDVLLGYLTNSASVINEPVCRQGIESDAEWVEANLGPFSQFTTYSELKVFNLSGVAVVDVLSPQQKAEFLLDADSGALLDVEVVKAVFTSLTESGGEEQLNDFFQGFTNIIKQKNITIVANPAAQDTILNLTLTALAPAFEDFEPEDFQLWFQVYLAPVMASLRPDSLRVIPRNISCASYREILSGLQQSLKFLPLAVSHGVRSSITSLKETFTGCSGPDSFACKKTTVDENLICAAVDSSKLQQTLSSDNSSTALCNFTITEHACSSATSLTHSNLVTLMKCSLESQRVYPVEVWKLFFQKASPALDQALETLATMAPQNSNLALSSALEALGEVKIANLSREQLQSENLISSLFQTQILPFLASPSNNFLFCLSSTNFSCATYRIVIQAFGNQTAFMDRDRQQAVFTHFIQPFLSRNDTSDPGCVSSYTNSKDWLQANLASFSAFATLQDIQALYFNFSSRSFVRALFFSAGAVRSELGASNDTDLIDRVFEELEDGNALENVDEFLTELTANGEVHDFQPAVRDHVMNRTFLIISPHLPHFNKDDYYAWFHVKLVSILASFTPVMLEKATSNVNCTNYHVIVSGIAKVFPAMPLHRKQGLTDVLLGYLTNSASVINEPVCRQGIESDAEWVEANLGPFSQFTTYSELKVFNLSGVAVVDVLSPQQKAEFLLDADSGALLDVEVVKAVFTSLTQSGGEEQLNDFFQGFTNIIKQKNITIVANPAAQDTILNLTLTALAPAFEDFEPEDFQLWFQVYLAPVMASLRPDSLRVIPRNISCASYREILSGLQQSLKFLPLAVSHGVRSSITSLKETFTGCSGPDSFACKKTTVDENLICAAVDSSKLQQTLSSDNSSTALCNFTITEHACSSATSLTHSNLVTLMKCSLESQRVYPVEVWKLFFQKASPALDQALETLATMAPQNSNLALSSALEALGEVKIANLSREQLQSENLISSLFQTQILPFLASPSNNFLFCLSSTNFSCATYRIVIQAFGNQTAFMDRDRQQAVFTHFIQPFLSRNDTSDPGCVSSYTNSKDWLQANLASFSAFATLQDIQALYFNFSSAEGLSELSSSQLAQYVQSSGASNDTDLIDRVFEELEDGNALENVDEFLTELTANGEVHDFQPAVRDHVMNRTFLIISPHLPHFNKDDYYAWFHVKLVSILASFTPVMLEKATSNVNCTNYHVIVSGVAKVFPAMPLHRKQGLTDVLLGYLTNSASVINEPVCRQGIESDAEWVEANLGPFSQFTTYSELKVFNLSAVSLLNSLSSGQKAEFLLEQNNLANETLVKLVFASINLPSPVEALGSFFDGFVRGSKEQNLTTLDPRVSETILNLTLIALHPKLPMLTAEDFKIWFQVYLPLFLPSVNSETLEIIPRSITCNSYQEIVKGLDNIFSKLSERQTQQVFTFTTDYLKRQSSSGFACVEFVNDDRLWLKDNFGQFVVHAAYKDFVTLKKNFNGVAVADLLTLNQLAQLAATPSQLNKTQDVTKVMAVINPVDFAAFFNFVSPAIEANPDSYTDEVKSAFLQEVFKRGNLSSPAVSDKEFLLWLRVRLSPLLVNLAPTLVTPLFNIKMGRSCNISQEMIILLDKLQMTLSNKTQQEIYRNILLFLQGPPQLKCYSDGSFYKYLRNTFLDFGFPDVSMFLSLLPPTRESELLSTISTSELHQFLSQPNVISNKSDICVIFNNYNNTFTFLETEDIRDDLKMVILPCVWPLALSSSSRSEADSWFDLRLKDYLRFLRKSMINFSMVQNATCFAFQKLVTVMGNNFTYSGSDFGQEDVYATINTYLRVGSGARCYNARDAELNSTAWFDDNIGSFVTYITLNDLTAFVSTTQIQAFLENQANLELFNNSAIPENVTDYYIAQLFAFNPAFSPVKLPGLLLCSSEVPALAYSPLNEADTIVVLNKLEEFCNESKDPEVSAALASNINTITTQTFVALGSSSAGLTTSQIASVPPSVLVSSLTTLASVSTWSQDQATTIVQIITSSGFQINSGAALESLGTLVVGVPSELIEKVASSELLSVSKNLAFVSNLLAAPTVVQQAFVKKIISVDTNPAKVVQNVPDAMASQIPVSTLLFSEETVNFDVINRKTWTQDQSAMFFGLLATKNVDIEQLSPSVLQGFTCTSVNKMTTEKIQGLVRASRPRRGRAKVNLKESQLTCMYNLLSEGLSQNFTDYPSDMLLFFSNTDVKKNNCRSYLSAVGAADFSVASTVLNKGSQLLSEARTCLDINGSNLSRDIVEVLGNMACTLDSSYIENGDPLILEKLKACKDFSDSQVAAMENLLLSGKTQYGIYTTWNEQTLENLGILPLYFTRNVWGQFKTTTKKKFLKSFMSNLRKAKTEKKKLKRLFKQLSPVIAKRGAGCTVGNITQVTVSDPSFPFGYDLTQFDLCLDVPVLKENLNSICEKVNDDDFQKIILRKLNEAFPSGVSDQEVQVLGSVSRVASLNDISKWNITKIDTLAALMESEDGPWEAAKSKEIINKYLNTSGTSLGSTELNVIDSNLCSLDTSTLMTISTDSIRNANLLNVAPCSIEQKRVLYQISNISFSSLLASSSRCYNLIKSYLGGAPPMDIAALSTQDISMDVDILKSLDPDVIAGLTVTDVQGLMGSHLPDLKLFENDTVIQTWVNLQLQSDLDKLGLGLVSNRISPTTAVTSTNGTTGSQTAAPNTNSTVTATPGNTNGSNVTQTPLAITTPAAATGGSAELAKSQTSLLLTALMLTMLHVLHQPA